MEILANFTRISIRFSQDWHGDVDAMLQLLAKQLFLLLVCSEKVMLIFKANHPKINNWTRSLHQLRKRPQEVVFWEEFFYVGTGQEIDASVVIS